MNASRPATITAGVTMSTDLRPIIVSLVPRAWSAKQAHNAVHMLQQVIAAIWHVHGDAMGRLVLGDLPARADEPVKPPAKKNA